MNEHCFRNNLNDPEQNHSKQLAKEEKQNQTDQL